MLEYPYTPKEEPQDPFIHYYGDIVRGCFMVSGFILLLANLFDQEFLGFYLVVGVIGVLIIVILAGLTSPRKKKVLIAETIIAGLGFVIFEYLAIGAYQHINTVYDLVFILRQTLAILFLVTLYYSVKNIRWVRQQEKSQ